MNNPNEFETRRRLTGRYRALRKIILDPYCRQCLWHICIAIHQPNLVSSLISVLLSNPPMQLSFSLPYSSKSFRYEDRCNVAAFCCCVSRISVRLAVLNPPGLVLSEFQDFLAHSFVDSLLQLGSVSADKQHLHEYKERCQHKRLNKIVQ